MVRYCPFCGGKVESRMTYCLHCGKKLPKTGKPVQPGITQPRETRYQYTPPPPQAVYYTPRYQTRPFHPSIQASLGDRCLALIIDNCISILISMVSCFIIYIPIGWLYDCFKDGIRDGQSFGKGGMRLRVVDYRTGSPATIGQSMIRNCLCGACDSSTCYCVAFLDSDGRRIGDMVAGTVVIKDY